MIYSGKFHVEGSLYGSEVSLFYGSRRLISLYGYQGNRTLYNSYRRELYRLRDRILLDFGNLEHLGFTVSEYKHI